MHKHAHVQDTKQNKTKRSKTLVLYAEKSDKKKTKIIWFVEGHISLFLRFLDLDIH